MRLVAKTRTGIVFFLYALCIISPAMAAVDEIYASYKYTFGDNDSKLDARRICFLEAKRKAIEKAGVYLQSTSVYENSMLKSDELKVYTAALLKVEVESEKVDFTGETMTMYMTVKTQIDTEEITRQLQQLARDQQAQDKLTKQQKQIADLEEKYEKLRKELAQADEAEHIRLRKESNVTFQRLTEVEKVKVDIAAKTQAATTSVALGMTVDEVVRVAGQPRQRASCLDSTFLNYGKVWVCFKSGVAKGLIRTDQWNGPCGSYDPIYRNLQLLR